MSESKFPNPRTSIFNPLAWDFTLLDKYANFIVSYVYAQSYPIQFAGPVYLTTRTALTQWASTAYTTSEIVAWVAANVPALLPVAQTWTILQYYFGGVAVDTLNPLTTGGTLLIGHGSVSNNVEIHSKDSRSTILHLGDGNTSTGAVHINNGTNTTGDVVILNGTGSTGTITLGSATSTTSLGCPLTPLYNSVSAGIGYSIPTTTFITNTITSGGTSTSVRSMVFPDGIWALYGEFLGTGTVAPFPQPGTFYGISFSTGLNGTGITIGQQKTGQQTPPTTNLFSATYFVIARLSGTIYLNGRSQTAYTLGLSQIIGIRIA